MSRSITVLGAGAIGVATALYLQRDGHRVTLVDRDPPGSGCSAGNAGLIQCAAVIPVATPGVVRAVPKMLIDPDQPLVMRWQHLPSLLPYLLRFLIEAQPGRAEANSRALASIIPRAYADYQPLIDAAGVQDMVRKAGELYVYETDQGFRSAKTGLDIRAARGVRFDVLDAGQVKDLEPALSDSAKHGVFVHDSYMTTDPYLFVSALAAHFVANGGTFVQANITDLNVQPDGRVRLDTDDGAHVADSLVIALGAFSRPWARKLGSKVTLNSERGYHVMLPQPGVPISRVVLSGEYKFAISPIGGGVRLAGTAELSRIGAPPNFDRAKRLLPLAQRLFPTLNDQGSTMWMGHRPSTPDSLPVIDRSPHHRNVFFAFGHGHTGLSLGGATGRIIADLVADRRPEVDIIPFRAGRF